MYVATSLKHPSLKIVCSDDKCFFTCSSNALAPKHTTKIRRPNDSRHALRCGGSTNIFLYPQKSENLWRRLQPRFAVGTVFFSSPPLLMSIQLWKMNETVLSTVFFLYSIKKGCECMVTAVESYICFEMVSLRR